MSRAVCAAECPEAENRRERHAQEGAILSFVIATLIRMYSMFPLNVPPRHSAARQRLEVQALAALPLQLPHSCEALAPLGAVHVLEVVLRAVQPYCVRTNSLVHSEF
eukprot:SAG31_NODE_3624_length_4058_cov_2.587270_3_plen_107_part_00